MDMYEFCRDLVMDVAPARDTTVLDYGCGSGRIVELLREAGYPAFGCDIFYGGGSYEAQVPPELTAEGIVRKMSLEHIPFGNESFDVVVSNQVFEHVEDLDLTLAEIDRVLRPGGYLLALFPDRSTWREGHCGIPLLHRFPKRSKVRVLYAAALRSLGFGYFKKDKSALQWSRDVCEWLDDWTFYRPYSEIRASFDQHFATVTHHEEKLLDRRLQNYPFLVDLPPRPAKQLATRKLAGMVIRAHKASRPQAPPSPARSRPTTS